MRFRWVLALASALAIAASATHAASPAMPRGIYLDTLELPPVQNETALDRAMGVQGVDGLVIVVRWSALEIGDGVYDLSPLVREATLAMRHRLKIELSIRADNPPGWLRRAGAQIGQFTYDRQSSTNECQSVAIAIPWDPVFQSKWKAMLRYVSQQLKGIWVDGKSAYDAVALLRLTGINRDSDELHLPAQDNTDCTQGNEQAWADFDYTPAALLYGWIGIVRSFNSAFRNKYFSVAIIDSTNPFPDFGDSSDSGSSLSQTQNQPLLTAAHQLLADRLVVQNNSLYENEPAEAETVYFASSLPALIAFQTNLILGPSGGAACDKLGTPCNSAQDFLTLLNTGIFPAQGLKANYIEVFAPNVNAFPSAIAIAHEELCGVGGTAC